MTEEALVARLQGIQKSLDDGFSAMDKRLGNCETYLNSMREEGIPRRITRIEQWKDKMGSKLWALATGVILALTSALLTLVIR